MTAHVVHRRRAFRPHVVRLAYFLPDTKVAPADTVAFLIEVRKRWPNLSFDEFVHACMLAELLWLQPRGRA
jgi:hypothetical protein